MSDKFLMPIAKGLIHNVAPGATTDIFATDLSPSNPPCLFRIMITVDAVTKLEVDITNGADEQTVILNGNSDLTANAVHLFDILVLKGDTINFQLDSAETILVMRVLEIPSAIT